MKARTKKARIRFTVPQGDEWLVEWCPRTKRLTGAPRWSRVRYAITAEALAAALMDGAQMTFKLNKGRYDDISGAVQAFKG